LGTLLILRIANLHTELLTELRTTADAKFPRPQTSALTVWDHCIDNVGRAACKQRQHIGQIGKAIKPSQLAVDKTREPATLLLQGRSARGGK